MITVDMIMAYLLLGACANFIISMFDSARRSADGLFIWATPKDVHDTTKMNWFGAVMIYLAMFAIDPVWYSLKLIWFSFHIGRKCGGTNE